MGKHLLKIIRDVYYNTSSPACFAGIDAVYREAKSRNRNIRRKDVEDFLAKQDSYTLHRQARRRFKRNKTETAGIDADWQADLADMRNVKQWNDHFTYILVCVDVLSRYGFSVPIKKKTTQNVADAFASVIKSTGRKPWFLTTDRGKEFIGKPFQNYIASQDIRHRFASSPDVKCAIAERYIRTLKGRIYRFFTTYNTKRYIDILPNIVNSINNSYHRTIQRTPASVSRKNQSLVWETLYGSEKKVKPKYKPGDRVRISIEKHVLSKGYRPNFSKEIFTIHKILRRYPATYKIKDSEGEVIEGVFYNEELVRILESDLPIRQIDRIQKSEKRNGELWHLVKFQDKKVSWIRNDKLVSI
jgi:hypothetical protein